MKGAILLLLVLAGCRVGLDGESGGAGNRLEAAAARAGLISAPTGPIVGLWTHDGARMCLGAPNPVTGRQPAALLLDDGTGDRCVAAGTAQPTQDGLRLELDRCRIRVRIEGSQIVLPDDPPCIPMCRVADAFASARLDRTGDTISEATAFRLPGGRTPCAG